MAIKDVSKQWAALLESEAAVDKEYTEACEEACEAIEKAEEAEIDEYDVEELDPAECGFGEAEDEVNEVVDPLQMWKDMKKNEPVKKNVKVDAKYIDTMKKLLSRIKTSKAQLYSTVMKKLNEYRAAGTELPPPEDYAENFVPFEMIAKLTAGKEDALPAETPADDDGDDVGDEDVSNAARSAKEYADTDNAFGNSDAEANLYDSEITEDEAEEAKAKVDDIIKKELKEKGSVKDMKKWLDDNKGKLDEVISKVKNEKTKDYLKKYVKFLGKYCNDELKESELDEAKGDAGHLAPIAKGIWKILKIVLGCGIMGVAGLSFCVSKLSGAIDGIGKKLGSKLMESLTLEVADDDELKEKEDVETLAEDGVTEAKKEKEEEKVNEADDREPASHLLDAVGVKASTASLKAQDTAMISVVEMLMKKIDKLETKLEEAKLNEYGHQRHDLSKKDSTISKAIVNHIEELTPEVLQSQEHAADLLAQWFAEEKVDTEYSRRVLKEIRFFPRFKNVSNIISYLMNMLGSGMGNKMTYGRRYESEGSEGEDIIPESDFFGEASGPSDAELDAIDAEAPVEVKQSDLEEFKDGFDKGLASLSKEETTQLLDNFLKKMETSAKKQAELGSGEAHDLADVKKACQKIKFYKDLSYEKPLTDAQKQEFSDLVYKYWYDWVPVKITDPETGKPEAMMMPVSEFVDRTASDSYSGSMFGRFEKYAPIYSDDYTDDDGNPIPFMVTDDNGNRIRLPGVVNRDVDDYKQRKSIEKREARQKAAADQAKVDAGYGDLPSKGNPETWSTNEWNRMIGQLSNARKKELKNDIIDSIQKDYGDSSADPMKDMQKWKDIAMVEYLFSGDKKARAETADRIRAVNKFKAMLNARLAAVHEEVAKKQAELLKAIEDNKKKLIDTSKALKDDPENEDLDVAADEAQFDYDEAVTAYDEFLNELQEKIPQTGDKDADKTALFKYALEEYPLTDEET